MACTDLSDQERTNAVLHLKGTGSYSIDVSEYDNMRITVQEIEFLLADGTSKLSSSAILLVGNIVIGHRDVTHTVRYRLTEENS